MDSIKFDCGCSFPAKKLDNNLYSVEVDINPENINYECKATWDLIASGDTIGLFQINSNLGQKLSEELKPENIHQLAALSAIMRPGAGESYHDGKSTTQHYIDRKNGEKVTYIHPALEPILKDTYGEMIYQEQIMAIAKEIAGFSPTESATLLKAVGKKKPELMAKTKKSFLDGCKKMGIVPDHIAEELFAMIEKSQRYSFNASHAYSYAVVGYQGAYAKSHFIRAFLTANLKHVKSGGNKKEEKLQALTNNCRVNKIDLSVPDFRNLNETYALRGKTVYVGLTNVKGVGESVFKKMMLLLNDLPPLNNWRYFDFLFKFAPKAHSKAIEALISVGAFSWLNNCRSSILYDYSIVSSLTDREIQIILDKQPETLLAGLKLLQEEVNKRRKITIDSLISKIEHPSHEIKDSIEWIAITEQALIGVPISCSKVDACMDASMANTTCIEFKEGKNGTIMLAAHVDDVREITIKNGNSRGQKMAFAKVSDSTCSIDSVTMFAEQWKVARGLVVKGNTVMIQGKRCPKKGSLLVNKVWQLL